MFILDAASISAWISAVLWPFFRIGGFFLAAPVFGTRLVPARTRVVLALLVTMILVPSLPAMPVLDTLSISSFIVVAQQLLIGIAMGFSMQLLLQLFVLGSQMIAMHMALGFASMWGINRYC